MSWRQYLFRENCFHDALPCPPEEMGSGSTASLMLKWLGFPPPPLRLGELMESALPLVFRGHEKDWLALAEFVRVKDGLAMGHAEERQHFMITGPHRGAEGPEVSLSPLGLRRDS